jgi:septal ring factor EnvC (AmiA/AmiB activator)
MLILNSFIPHLQSLSLPYRIKENIIMKRFQAMIAATITTGLIVLGMMVIGVEAAANTDTAPVSNSAAAATVVPTGSTTNQIQSQINQLQNLIKQYQSREQQYQTEISKLSQQLSDSGTQVNQLQDILTQLQQRGVIQITADGQIQVRER